MPKLDSHPRIVAKAAAIDKQRTKYAITGIPGLILECAPDGSRSWYARYQIGHGRSGRKLRYHRLGAFNDGASDHLTLGQAKDKAAALQVDAKRHRRDTFAEERIEVKPEVHADTFDALVRLWIERHGKQHKRSWKRDEDLHERLIAPRLGARLVKDVTRQDVLAALDDIGAKIGLVQANRVQAVISACFSWALDEGHVQTHPAFRLRKRGKETVRDRHLSADELRAFWTGLETLPPAIADALRVLALTGQRRTEVGEMAIDELELSGAPAWTLPAARTKNKLAHVVPLTPMVLEIVQRNVESMRGRYIFPARLMVPKPIAGSTLSARFADLMRALKIKGARLHDLRHTAKTGFAQLGVPDNISDRVTNQITGQRARVGSRYDHHTYLDEKRRALEIWEKRLMEIVEGKPPSGLRW